MFPGLPVIALTFAAAALEPAAPVETIESGLDRLEAAWQAGDLHEVSHVAHETLRLIETDACAWRADAAIVAAMGFVAGFQEGPSSTGYSAWVVDRVSGALPDVLPQGLRAAAAEMRAKPGEYVSLDYRFATSPYLDPPGDVGCAAPRLDARLLHAEPRDASSAVVALWLGDGGHVPASRVELLYAYPASEGEQVLDQIRDSPATVRIFEPVRVLALNPCATFRFRDGEYLRLCRSPTAPAVPAAPE